MALKKTITLHGKTQTIVPGLNVIEGERVEVNFEAYYKVTDVAATKSAAVARVQATDTSTGAVLNEHGVEFTPDLEGPNFIKQAYAHLKTLPEFADAVDC